MKKLLLTFLILTGCSIEPYVIQKAEEFCKDKGGIQNLEVFNVPMVFCIDGSYKDIIRDN